jgi:hypothetical protein
MTEFDNRPTGSMLKLMDFNDENTWPPDVLAYLARNHGLFLNWVMPNAGAQAHTTTPQQYDKALEGLRAVFNNHSLHGYHCTRMTAGEIRHIETTGMQLPNGAMLRQRIQSLEAEGLITASVARALIENNQADAPIRAGKIWFCFFEPHLGGESGIGSLLRYWGGEALYRSHDQDPERGPVLERLGTPCLVEADVPIASLRGPSFLDMKAVDQFLKTRGAPTNEPLEHEDYALRAIPAQHIRRVIQFPEPDFVSLTRCNTWRRPLG